MAKVKVYWANCLLPEDERYIAISSDLNNYVVIGWFWLENFNKVYKEWVKGNYSMESSPYEEVRVVKLPHPMKFKQILNWLNESEVILPIIVPENLTNYMRYVKYYNSIEDWLKEVEENAQSKFITG